MFKPLLKEMKTAAHLNPAFKTLRVTADEQTSGLKLRIRFICANPLDIEIAVDDIHVVLFERFIGENYRMTLGHISEVILTKDNTILKEDRSYSLCPGDGFEIDLVIGMSNKGDDPARVIFGLVIDYITDYAKAPSRKTMPSDCIYMVRYKSLTTFGPKTKIEIVAIDTEFLNYQRLKNSNDAQAIEYLETLQGILEKHQSFRPIPTT